MVDVCYVVLGLMVCVSVALDEVVLKLGGSRVDSDGSSVGVLLVQ